MKLRNSQQTIFWKNHQVWEIKVKDKLIGWFGKRFPKTAQERVEEVE